MQGILYGVIHFCIPEFVQPRSGLHEILLWVSAFLFYFSLLNISEMKHLNNGECADIYEVDSHTVLKLGKPGWSKDMLYQEYLNGKLVGDIGIPAPKVYDFVEIDGRYGYTMDKLWAYSKSGPKKDKYQSLIKVASCDIVKNEKTGEILSWNLTPVE